jgi:hypothetical protein
MPDDNELILPSSITKDLFLDWRYARRGENPAEDLTNPYWVWMFENRKDPYRMAQHFLGDSEASLPPQPRWCGMRLGQTRTLLSDGREIFIAGEHEDHYDPDFFVYNDVIVRDSEGQIEILAYPESHFPRTDFHSASLVEDETEIVLIGNLSDQQGDVDRPKTQVFVFDVETKLFERLETSGIGPGLIHHHDAKYVDSDHSVVISNGCKYVKGVRLESVNDWKLDLVSGAWSRLTDNKWKKVFIRRTDRQAHHLFSYESVDWCLRLNRPIEQEVENLKARIGVEGGFDVEEVMGVFRSFFVPEIAHEPIESHSDFDFKRFGCSRVIRVKINNVVVRMMQQRNDVSFTVEGVLPDAVVQEFSENLHSKLEFLEQAKCEIEIVELS